MSKQQFAEPEWQSPQQRNVNTDAREQQMYNPQPFTVDPREKIQPRSRPRRPWLWIIIALIVLALLGTGINAGLSGIQTTSTETHTYTVSTHPTLVINDDTGSITIHRGSTNSQITIQATKHMQQFGFGNRPDIEYNKDGDTVTATEDNGGGFGFFSNRVDFDVTVPADADLQIHTDTGTIDVSGVNGTMSLTTDTGSINATQDTLSGESTLKSDTGSITFVGSINANGDYQFTTDTGSVNVTLPGNSAFHVDAKTDTGSINSDFTEVNVQHNDVVGSEAHGDVGSPPSAKVTLETNTGSINLHKGE